MALTVWHKLTRILISRATTLLASRCVLVRKERAWMPRDAIMINRGSLLRKLFRPRSASSARKPRERSRLGLAFIYPASGFLCCVCYVPHDSGIPLPSDKLRARERIRARACDRSREMNGGLLSLLSQSGTARDDVGVAALLIYSAIIPDSFD